MRSRFTLSLTILLSVCVLAIPAASPAHAQASAVLKAQQAQAESQKQSVAKQGAANKLDALKAAGLNAPEVDDLISTLEDPTAREKLVSRLKALRAVGSSRPVRWPNRRSAVRAY
jgi:endonuclease/exonuclease/phosphatase (EEP) superfamily protein YafD